MKYFLLVVFLLSSCAREIKDNNLKLGTGTANDVVIEASIGNANNPKILFDTITNLWKFTNDGTTFVDFPVAALPSVTGNSGKVLYTNGTSASWERHSLPSYMSDGNFLKCPNFTGCDQTVDGWVNTGLSGVGMSVSIEQTPVLPARSLKIDYTDKTIALEAWSFSSKVEVSTNIKNGFGASCYVYTERTDVFIEIGYGSTVTDMHPIRPYGDSPRVFTNLGGSDPYIRIFNVGKDNDPAQPFEYGPVYITSCKMYTDHRNYPLSKTEGMYNHFQGLRSVEITSGTAVSVGGGYTGIVSASTGAVINNTSSERYGVDLRTGSTASATVSIRGSIDIRSRIVNHSTTSNPGYERERYLYAYGIAKIQMPSQQSDATDTYRVIVGWQRETCAQESGTAGRNAAFEYTHTANSGNFVFGADALGDGANTFVNTSISGFGLPNGNFVMETNIFRARKDINGGVIVGKLNGRVIGVIARRNESYPTNTAEGFFQACIVKSAGTSSRALRVVRLESWLGGVVEDI
jgi:hypothetical protein